MLMLVSMGCGGSRSAAIEPRYHESRDTESTWLTDTEMTQLAGTAHNPTGGTDIGNTAPTGSGKREDDGSCVKERKLVNAGTQCCRSSTHTNINQRAQRTQVRNKAKKISQSPVSL
ncbi:BAALC binder of MAP3K1 and KLF4 a [Triplophysa dalaica]|uniref:BAALC binder of MAP3K1 and KLF4 a n=1 Tax=Triplophysa dalaica TaxID=1582913 RepID=UPI0024E00F68|nr:BAALC binder of MAP3K1 and KLF4 a [Triplophysa dalaica]